MSGARTTAVFVTYRSAKTIGTALAAAKRAHEQGLLECVVVDNGSTDDTVAILREHESWARVILTGKNLGFGRGCNRGLREVQTPCTIFINPDAKVDESALLELQGVLDTNPRVGIVGPAIIEGGGDHPADLQITGHRPTPGSIIRASLPSKHAPHGNRPIVPGSAPFRTGWVCGAVLMARTDLLRRLGGFDPRFFLYWEETDLCKRAEAMGFETWAVGRAVATHIGGASSSEDNTRIGGCISRFYFQSRYYYLTKHHGLFAACTAELVEYGFLLARTCVDMAKGRGSRRLVPRRQIPLCSLPDPVSDSSEDVGSGELAPNA